MGVRFDLGRARIFVLDNRAFAVSEPCCGLAGDLSLEEQTIFCQGGVEVRSLAAPGPSCAPLDIGPNKQRHLRSAGWYDRDVRKIHVRLCGYSPGGFRLRRSP